MRREHTAAVDPLQVLHEGGVGARAHPLGASRVIRPGHGRQILDETQVAPGGHGHHPRLIARPGIGDIPGGQYLPELAARQRARLQPRLFLQLPDSGGGRGLAGLHVAAGQRPAVPVAPLHHEQHPVVRGVRGHDGVRAELLAPVPELVPSVPDAGRGVRVDWPPIDRLERDRCGGLPLRPVDPGGIGLRVGPSLGDALAEHVGVRESAHAGSPSA